MSRRAQIFSVLTISLAASASFTLENQRARAAQNLSMTWAQTHATMTMRSPTAALLDPYWAWRAPPAEDLATRLATVEPMTVLRAGAGQEVWAINAVAGIPPKQVIPALIPLVALSTATFLGIEIEDDHGIDLGLENTLLASLNPWHQALEEQCIDCAPAASPLPARSAISPARGISILVNRLQRSVLPLPDAPTPIVAMVHRIREGGLPNEAEWSTVGLAGMAALELGAQDRTEQIPMLLEVAQSGPSATDRIAALWAARKMGASNNTINQVESKL